LEAARGFQDDERGVGVYPNSADNSMAPKTG
jgi:hypothetical protein